MRNVVILRRGCFLVLSVRNFNQIWRGRKGSEGLGFSAHRAGQRGELDTLLNIKRCELEDDPFLCLPILITCSSGHDSEREVDRGRRRGGEKCRVRDTPKLSVAPVAVLHRLPLGDNVATLSGKSVYRFCNRKQNRALTALSSNSGSLLVPP